jgi:hypothetical protein
MRTDKDLPGAYLKVLSMTLILISFRLKSWADRFMILRAGVYEAELREEDLAFVGAKGMYKPMPHRRFELLF